ncbi:MAG: Lrp/AsnC family transcriptional regulator [Clostridia bacterium]|nr:Lrp/AsnC family transcriptional regulator [Clostridia bacterium]
MDKLLKIIENNCDLTNAELAVMTGMTEEEVAAAIEQYKKDGIIIGKRTIINWHKVDKNLVTAFIEVKVTPQLGQGFDRIAERFFQFDQVKTVYLMSGAYDLALIVEGNSLNEVAGFVSEHLAPMEMVISTATHFVLKKYKSDGMIIENPVKDERQVLLF